jgi:hypothetical protein
LRRRTPISIPGLAFFLGLILLLSGCRRIQETLFGDRIEEGVITYDVTFPYSEEEGLMASMLPSEMTMKFKEDRYVTELTAGMGMFKMKFIADNQKKVLYHTLEMMKDKIMVEMNERGARKMLQDFPNLRILEGKGTDSLAGLPCKKALGFFAPPKEPPMDIYHTDRIALKDPNWCNQFHELDGVLMGYEVMRFGKRMRLRAEKVEAKEVPDKAFSTEKYEQVSVEKMNRTMEKLMKSLE